MATSPARPRLRERAVAALFAAGFFAALPAWFLSPQEGPEEVACGGTPWRCTVAHRGLLSSRTETLEPSRVHAEARTIAFRERSGTAWQLVFDAAGTSRDVLSSPTLNETVRAVAVELEAARARGDAIERSVAPDGVYGLALGLVGLFAAAGAGLVLLGARG